MSSSASFGQSTILSVFTRCVEAISSNVLIHRESRQDKEFHFQNWVEARLTETHHLYDPPGRNVYPDFRMVHIAEGYEVKGLAYPGREANYDANSQIPSGNHNGRAIFYIFGRYPKEPDGNTYPVLDFVVCHGDFLNAEHGYQHKNKSFRSFGSYGDILVRDRKMYVAPTPFGLATGFAHNYSLVLPVEFVLPPSFSQVGKLVRKEVDKLTVSYSFDLRSNTLTTASIPNPSAGKEHTFLVWRLQHSSDEPVQLRDTREIQQELEAYEKIQEDEENA